MPLQNLDRDVLRDLRSRGDPGDRRPVLGRNAFLGPIGNRAPLGREVRMSRQRSRPTQEFDDVSGRKRFFVSEHTALMPDNLAHRKNLFARVTGERSASDSGMLLRMPKKPPSQLQIAITARLRAVQAELGKTDEQMAVMAKRGRTTWTNWVNRENMPVEQAMVDLCQAASISMDWLYRGVAGAMPTRLVIRLELRIAGLDPDNATPEQVAPIAARVAASVLASA